MTRDLADTVKGLRTRLGAALYLRNAGNAKDDGAILDAILPLIEAELAQATADALERIERLECQLAGCDVAAMGWADKNPNSPPPKQGDWGWSPAFQSVLELRQKWEAQREHDAKIRREAYLRCAELIKLRSGKTLLREFERTFRQWANEADGGGK